MKRTFALLSCLLVTGAAGASFAQLGGDVCCILGKVSGDSAETRAVTKSPSDCVTGRTYDGYRVCSAAADPNNLCSTFSGEKQCQSCGFHWAGKVCMPEDPVKKAKESLKEDEKKKAYEQKYKRPYPETPKSGGDEIVPPSEFNAPDVIPEPPAVD
jgi:hypothetical protein